MAVVAMVLAWLASSGGLLWKISQAVAASEANGEKVEALAKAFAEHTDELDEHRRDNNVHTTFEQRQAIYSRLDKIENSVQDGHNRIENKIDRLTEMVFKK